MPKNTEHSKINSQKTMLVEVSLPSLAQIELVQANELRRYEIFGWFASLFSSAAVGFWTAFIPDANNLTLKGVSIVFTFFAIVFVIAAAYYRSKLKTDGVKKVASLEDFKTR